MLIEGLGQLFVGIDKGSHRVVIWAMDFLLSYTLVHFCLRIDIGLQTRGSVHCVLSLMVVLIEQLV